MASQPVPHWYHRSLGPCVAERHRHAMDDQRNQRRSRHATHPGSTQCYGAYVRPRGNPTGLRCVGPRSQHPSSPSVKSLATCPARVWQLRGSPNPVGSRLAPHTSYGLVASLQLLWVAWLAPLPHALDSRSSKGPRLSKQPRQPQPSWLHALQKTPAFPRMAVRSQWRTCLPTLHVAVRWCLGDTIPFTVMAACLLWQHALLQFGRRPSMRSWS